MKTYARQDRGSSDYFQLSELSLCSRYLLKRVGRGSSLSGLADKSTLRKVLEWGGVALCCGSRAPYIPLSLAFAGNHTWFGVILAAANTGSFAGITSWAWLSVVKDELRPLSQEELDMEGRKSASYGSKSAWLSVYSAVGIISQFPSSYLAWYWTSGPMAWVSMGTVLIFDSPMPIYSLWSSRVNFRKTGASNLVEKRLAQMRSILMKRIRECHQRLLKMKPHERNTFILAIRQLPKQVQNGDLEQLNQAVELILKEEAQDGGPSWLGLGGKGASRLAGYWAGGALELFIVYSGYLGTTAFTGSEVAGYLGGLVTGMCNAKFVWDGVVQAPSHLFQGLTDVVTGNPSVASWANPALYYSLRGVSLLFAGFAWGPVTEASETFFDGKFADFMKVSCGTAISLLAAFALGQAVEGFTRHYVRRFADSDTKQTLSCCEDLEQLEAFYGRVPFLHLARHLLELPPSLSKINKSSSK